MKRMTNAKTESRDTERALYQIRDAPPELITRLSAPERILARSIRQQLGVAE